MSNKNISDGQERFDGFAVTLYDGKFSGTFDLDEGMALEVGFDDVVTFVVTARVGGVNFGETKLGDVKRTNSFSVTSAVALGSDLMAKIGTILPNTNSNQIPGQQSIYDLPDDDDDDDDDTPVAATPAPLTTPDPILAGFLQQS